VSKNKSTTRCVIRAGGLACVMLFVAMACTPSYTYQMHRPASIDLGERQDYSIAIVNSPAITKFNFKRKNKNIVFANAVDYLDYHIAMELNAVPNFRVIQNDTSKPVQRYFNSTQQLNRKMISEFCQEYDVNFLVGLESFNARFSRSIQSSRNADGSKDRTADFFLSVQANIAVFDSAGTVLFREQFFRDMFYQQRNVIIGLLAVGPQIQFASKEIKVLCEGIVDDFVASYYPSVTVQTQFFTEVVILRMRCRLWSQLCGVERLIFYNQ